ncbi:MAG: AraC-like DNA-binding protein [Glaciecola sp.]|jgi:AraC-like DNA-binding protein
MRIENKPTNHHTIASYFARTHIKNMVCQGANEQHILAKAGLTSAQLQQLKSRVSPAQLASIIDSSWRLNGDEFLGLTEQKVKRGMFALLAGRLISCKTLEEVLSHTSDFYNLTGDQLQFEIEKKEANVFCSLNANFESKRTDSTPNSLLTELLLLIFHRFASWLIGELIPLNKVCVQHIKPAHHEEYRLMFPCRCEFENRKNALVFDAKYLRFPVVQNADSLSEYLEQVPLQWLRKQSYYDTYSAKVIRVLENSVLEEETHLDSVASTLNMSARTLRRKLIAEGCRFQQLKDNMRRDKAINLFEQDELTIAQIGLAIGFTELATFSRAFKHWTGVSPSTYRRYRS